ncbi:MAG: right-handed parallel beta-helix repeat-containing protein, partial [Candidatus Thorarchaeota archaeon]
MSVDHTGKMVVAVILVISLVAGVFIVVGFNTILSGIETTTTTTVPTSTNTTLTTTLLPTTTTQTTTQQTTIPLINHDPISINGDGEFAAQVETEGWLGSGSVSSPYIIENLRIEGSRVSISILHCTAHFIIRNCVLLPEHEYLTWGVDLWDSDNALVEDCTIVADIGVDFMDTTNCRAVDCIIDGSWVGVNVSFSENALVENNHISSCEFGIWVDKSQSAVIRGNELLHNNYAIEISVSSDSSC